LTTSKTGEIKMKKVTILVILFLTSAVSMAATLEEIYPNKQNPSIIDKNGEQISSVTISNLWVGGLKHESGILFITTNKNTYIVKLKSVADAASIMQAINKNSVVSVRNPQNDEASGKILVQEIMISKTLQ